MVDAGGVGFLTAVVRRWCTECRGRESVLLGSAEKKGGRGKKKGKPAAKRSKIHGNKPKPSSGKKKSKV